MRNWKIWALLPVLAVQGLWVAGRAVRLPEAAGARAGSVGSGPPLRLLVVGDSSAAGVGVTCQTRALSGCLSARLGRGFDVSWRLIAVSGATTQDALTMLRAAPEGRFDVAVVALGVNDCKNGVRQVLWRAQTRALYAHLRAAFGVRLICASALPPMGEFPALPKPLSTVLGARAAAFNVALAEETREMADVRVVHPEFQMDPSMMAEDGFHPGEEVYAAWAEALAEVIEGAL